MASSRIAHIEFSEFHAWKKAAGVTYGDRTLATLNWPEMARHVPQGYDYAAVSPQGDVVAAWSDKQGAGYVRADSLQD